MAEKHTHTPGPWHPVKMKQHHSGADFWEVAWSPDGELVCERVYGEANARLIAAAPAMLAELKNGEAGLVMLLRAIEEGDPAGELSVRVRDMIASYRAAIAQAKGE